MKQQPSLNNAIAAFAIPRMVDDTQTERRDPNQADIQLCIDKCTLAQGDQKSQGQRVGKAKRVRSVLTWVIEHASEYSREFVEQMVTLIRSCGGFQPGAPNYVGEEAIICLRDALLSKGFLLTPEGEIRTAALDILSGTEVTDTLASYVRRAQKGAADAAIVAGTGKDLLEAVAAHVLFVCGNTNNPPHNFPILLSQAFVALELKTSADKAVNGDPPEHRFQRALFEGACAVNTLRNRQGSGNGSPWLPTVTPEKARRATQVMGIVGDLMLRTLKEKQSL